MSGTLSVEDVIRREMVAKASRLASLDDHPGPHEDSFYDRQKVKAMWRGFLIFLRRPQPLFNPS